MEPKKKRASDFIVPLILLCLASYIALHMASAYEVIKQEVIQNVGTKGESIGRFFGVLFERLETSPFKLEWCESSLKFLLIAGVICLVAFLYMYTTRKNYIDGKEYGTSEWGKKGQLDHLTAKNVLKQKIKEIKSSRGGQKAKEIREAKKKYTEESNIILTQTEKVCMYNYELNNNSMIIGGSGSGKTRGYVLPNLLQSMKGDYSPSFVVTDPKGEILVKVGKYLKEQGYEIKVLNLKEQNRSFCFNPFKYIIEEKYEEQISNLVSAIMDSRVENKLQKGNDPFWDDMTKVLLKAIFYFVYEGMPEEERHMGTVMELFRWFEITEDDDRDSHPTKLDCVFDMFGDKYGVYEVAEQIAEFYNVYVPTAMEATKVKPELDVVPKRIRELIPIPLHSERSDLIDRYMTEIVNLTEVAQKNNVLTGKLQECSISAINAIETYKRDRFSGYAGTAKPTGVEAYERFGDENNNPAMRNWEDFRTKCKGKTAQSVTATALSKLAPFDEMQIRRIFSKDEMELDLVGERKTALFIILPPTNKNYNFIANVLYTMLFEQLEYCATVKHNQTLPVPVRFILDEFYNTGKIPNFENILSYARSFGIGISIILQSLDQIKEMYEKSWGTVLDNCSTLLYLGGIRHADTLEYISKLLGKGTFDKKTYSRTKGRQSSSNTNYDKIGRELLDPSEVQRIPKDRCLLFVSGYQPFYSKKFNYKTHKNYKYTSDANRKNTYAYKLPGEN